MDDISERRRVVGDAGVAGVAGAAAVAGSYAVAGFTPAFVAAPVEGALARTMPGVVVTLAITLLGSLGQQLNLLTAVGLAAVGLGVPALVGRRAARGSGVGGAVVATLGASGGVALLVWALTLAPRSAAGAAGGAALVLGVVAAADRLDAPRLPTDTERRGMLAATAGAALVGTAAGSRLFWGADESERRPLPAGEAGDLLQTARDRGLDVAGLEPLVSNQFYNVDINAVDPTVDPESWSLTVTGAVEEEVTVDLDDLRATGSREEFASLRCVGESLNGRKLDTALWTVVDLMPLLERAGVDENCCVMLRAADGFFEEFPLEALRTGRLAFGMNGRDLPRSHGAPVRALIPGHWGEINVKWLTEIEVLDEPADGYWEKRGWHGTGPVETVAKLHVTNRLSDGRIEVAGHAYAGTRGIETVAVSVDDGEWVEAELSEPLPDADVWRQWVYRYDPPETEHEVTVRATDGEEQLQPREESGAFPSGPTGWVTKSIQP